MLNEIIDEVVRQVQSGKPLWDVIGQAKKVLRVYK